MISDSFDESIFKKIDDGNYYDIKSGNTYIMPKDKKFKYYNMLLNVPIIKENEIVKIIFHEKNEYVIFDGLVAWSDGRYGGFSIKGFIDLKRDYIGLNYDLENNNNYRFVGFKINSSEIKGKVK